MSTLAAGLLLGLAGSVHCAVMCGPLVLSLGGWVDPRRARLPPILAYHAGRVIMYLLLALAAGATGRALSYGGFGRAVSVGSGLLLLILAAGRGSRLVPRRGAIFWSLVITRACVAASRSTRVRPLAGQFAAGAVNGLLPCGLVYAAAIAAAGFGSVPAALTFMSGFGLGTVPVLLGIGLSSSSLSPSTRTRLRKLTPAALALTGALLIVRGVLPPHHFAAHESVFHHMH